MKSKKMYFLEEDSEFCQYLEYFTIDELEKVNFEIIEAIPATKGSSIVWCSYNGCSVEKSECIKSECNRYKSNKSGRGTCVRRSHVYYYGDKVNVKQEFENVLVMEIKYNYVD